jgi:glutamate racemase
VLWGEERMKDKGKLSRVLVMATPVTISQAKFAHLTEEYGKRADIIPLPCPHLAELIENKSCGAYSEAEERECLHW